MILDIVMIMLRDLGERFFGQDEVGEVEWFNVIQLVFRESTKEAVLEIKNGDTEYVIDINAIELSPPQGSICIKSGLIEDGCTLTFNKPMKVIKNFKTTLEIDLPGPVLTIEHMTYHDTKHLRNTD